MWCVKRLDICPYAEIEALNRSCPADRVTRIFRLDSSFIAVVRIAVKFCAAFEIKHSPSYFAAMLVDILYNMLSSDFLADNSRQNTSAISILQCIFPMLQYFQHYWKYRPRKDRSYDAWHLAPQQWNLFIVVDRGWTASGQYGMRIDPKANGSQSVPCFSFLQKQKKTFVQVSSPLPETRHNQLPFFFSIHQEKPFCNRHKKRKHSRNFLQFHAMLWVQLSQYNWAVEKAKRATAGKSGSICGNFYCLNRSLVQLLACH